MSRQFAQLLLKENLITQEQFKAAEDSFIKSKEDMIQSMRRAGVLKEPKILEHFSKKLGVPTFDLSRYAVSADVIKMFPREDVGRLRLIPVQKAKGTLVVALCDPTALSNLDDVKFRTQLRVEAVMTTISAYEKALETYYGKSGGGMSVAMPDNLPTEDVEDAGGESAAHDITDGQIDAPIVQLVNSILLDSIKKKASDIHIEPYEKALRVRLRIDGALYETMRPPLNVRNAVIARIKIMARMDIAEKRLPQDGRIKIRTSIGEMDFRVSTMPTIFGEKAVLRLLNKGALQTDLTKLGFDKRNFDYYVKAINEPYGMVLVTGPTGSGKTTTLYSAISELNKPENNVSTAEDPVEFNLEGVNQLQTHADIGLNFSAALRTMMRQDPDVILVGEIRDKETAEVAVQAALTGHLVLSTLHTNDAPSTVTRMVNMGVEPFLITAALNLVTAQRLLRKICGNCRTETSVPIEQLTSLGIELNAAKQLKLFKGAGCEACSHTGYSGRMAIHEVMPFTTKLKEAVLAGTTAVQLKKLAIQEGMKTLRMAALVRVAEGKTSLEEALANTLGDF